MSGLRGIDFSLRSCPAKDKVVTPDMAIRYILAHVGQLRTAPVEQVAKLAAQRMDEIKGNSGDLQWSDNRGKIYARLAEQLFHYKLHDVERFLSAVIKHRISTSESREFFWRGIIEAYPNATRRAGEILAGILIEMYPNRIYEMANYVDRYVATELSPHTGEDEFRLGMASRIYRGDPILTKWDLLLERVRGAGFWDPRLVKLAESKRAKGEQTVNIIDQDGCYRMLSQVLNLEDVTRHLNEQGVKNLQYCVSHGIAIESYFLARIIDHDLMLKKFFEQEDLSLLRFDEDPVMAGWAMERLPRERLFRLELTKGYLVRTDEFEKWRENPRYEYHPYDKGVYGTEDYDFSLSITFNRIEEKTQPILGGAKYLFGMVKFCPEDVDD
jgi:hypothetical protein